MAYSHDLCPGNSGYGGHLYQVIRKLSEGCRSCYASKTIFPFDFDLGHTDLGHVTIDILPSMSCYGGYFCHARLTICRMRNRRFSKDIRAINFRFRKDDPQKVDKVYLFQF